MCFSTVQLLAGQQLQTAASRRRSTRPVRAPALAAQRYRPAGRGIRSEGAAPARQFPAGILPSCTHRNGPEPARCRSRAGARAGSEARLVKYGCRGTMLPPMTIRPASNAADVPPTAKSLHGLDAVNFFLAGVQAGCGPYMAVYLADLLWLRLGSDPAEPSWAKACAKVENVGSRFLSLRHFHEELSLLISHSET